MRLPIISYTPSTISHSLLFWMKSIWFYWTRPAHICLVLCQVAMVMVLVTAAAAVAGVTVMMMMVVVKVLEKQKTVFNLPDSVSSSFDWKKGKHSFKKVDFEMAHIIAYFILQYTCIYAGTSGRDSHVLILQSKNMCWMKMCFFLFLLFFRYTQVYSNIKTITQTYCLLSSAECLEVVYVCVCVLKQTQKHITLALTLHNVFIFSLSLSLCCLCWLLIAFTHTPTHIDRETSQQIFSRINYFYA